MPKTYLEVLHQIEALKQEADGLKQRELEEVIAKIKEAIAIYELTAEDLGLTSRRGRVEAGKKTSGEKTNAVTHQDANGNTWGGRGPRPRWLREALESGAQLTDFAIRG